MSQPMPKPRKYDDALRKLRKYDKRFEEHARRGKGSERMIFHPDIGGRPVSYPVKYHGKPTELRLHRLSAIIRAFGLPDDFFS